MLAEFKDYIAYELLFSEKDNLLLGISGGIDSMVMFDLFASSPFRTAAAHCNFSLRGEESDADQIFVEEACRMQNILIHTKSFSTREYAMERGISIQMAARELRYSWFEELSIELNYDYIVIAHNKNDLVETFLLNIARGTGIKGLTGIKPKNGKIVRPLLFAQRTQISEYADRNNISYREDTSNLDIKYKRNRIRLKIIPEFIELSPAFINSISETADRLKEAEMIFSQSIKYNFENIYEENEQGGSLNIDQLLELKPLNTYLFEFLRKWNFSKELIPDIITSLNSSSGKQFYSPTHRLVKDRDKLLITPLKEEGISRFYIEEGITELSFPLRLKISIHTNNPGFHIPKSSSIACIDLHLVHFPLIVRKWEKGDYFQPLGMSGLKKVSDFFIDNKLSLVDKDNTWIIASGSKIVWIAGQRIDDRFKINERTNEILMIELVT
ncbi:MAG: tRNA lysidine(34) synthetase TilS [Bacteroidales bacterium]